MVKRKAARQPHDQACGFTGVKGFAVFLDAARMDRMDHGYSDIADVPRAALAHRQDVYDPF